MKKIFTFILLVNIFVACSDNTDLKTQEIELREKELELREREFELEKVKNEAISQSSIEVESTKNKSSVPKTTQSKEKTKEELRNELLSMESYNPQKYLSINYTYKVNLASNTIVEGSVKNSASIARFKNIRVKVIFYSKTDAVVGSETFTIMEFLPSGRSKSFRHRISGWWKGISYSKYTILSAETY